MMVGTLKEPWLGAVEVRPPSSICEVSDRLGSGEWVLWSKNPDDVVTRVFAWYGERYVPTTLGVAY